MSLKIYAVIMQLLSDLRSSIERIEQRDRDLGRQMRRACQSMALNCSEGAYSQKGNKRARYFVSLGSTREVLSCLEVGAALGYVAPVAPAMLDRFDHVLGTLVKLTK